MADETVTEAGEALGEYRRKRNFEATPEPSGGEGPAPAAAGSLRFVVQEHHATALHWDLRLEHEGVLPSWAVPKGIPADPRVDHLAVRTEDHPMEYLDFHGVIPEGGYGAGTMKVWDHGTYELEKFSDREVKVVLHGERTEGRYVLFRTGGRRGRDWMIHRMSPPADPSRGLMPTGLRPMLATVAEALPADADAFGYEVLWAGTRVVVAVDGGRVDVTGADGTALGPLFPELRAMGLSLGAVSLVLDGVLVTFGADGRPDPGRMARRLEAGTGSRSTRSTRVRRLSESVPAVLIAFDLLWLEGHDTTGLPGRDRRSLLEEIGLTGPSWQVPAGHADGAALLVAVGEQGLPGVVAKRLDAVYRPGETSPDWVEVPAPEA